MSENKPKILIVDDHALYRLGIKSIVNDYFNQSVTIYEAEDGKQTFEYFENNDLPDLVFLDIILPDTTGVEIAKILKRDYPELAILILSSEISTTFIDQLLEIDINGYINKTASADVIKEGIKVVLNGEKFYSKSVSKLIYEIYMSSIKNPIIKGDLNRISTPAESLSKREIEIIEMLSNGMSSKEIGDSLFISSRTVEGHKVKLMKRLNLNTNADVIKFAIKHKIIEL